MTKPTKKPRPSRAVHAKIPQPVEDVAAAATVEPPAEPAPIAPTPEPEPVKKGWFW